MGEGTPTAEQVILRNIHIYMHTKTTDKKRGPWGRKEASKGKWKDQKGEKRRKK